MSETVERLERDAILVGCVCHEMHFAGGMSKCPVCLLAESHARLRAAPEVAETEALTALERLERVAMYGENTESMIASGVREDVQTLRKSAAIAAWTRRTPSEPVSREGERRIECWTSEKEIADLLSVDGGMAILFDVGDLDDEKANLPCTLILRTPEPVTPLSEQP